MTESMVVETAPCVLAQDASFVDSLSEPLQRFAKAALLKGESQSSAAARMDDLEIQVRSYVLVLTKALLNDPTNQETRIGIEDYWKSSLALCLHIVHFASLGAAVDTPYQGLGGAVIRKLPFLLLEDIMETLTLEMGKAFWDMIVEPSVDKLCGSELFVKTSHLVWIRVCNKLLKEQSGGEWAGRILLSLASVFPLSERSAINVLGSFHVDNITTYETIDEFESHEKQEEANEFDSSVTAPKTEQEYTFYQTFWGIQKDFSNPNQVNFPDFIERVQTILAILESHAFPKQQQSKRGGNEEEIPENDTTTTDGHQKYLTNSQLLHLQLKDPELRIHLLTQFLIVESFLSEKEGTSRFVQNKMIDLTKRAKDLLKHTPFGSKHLTTIDWLLKERESMWRKWKRNKCKPDLEKNITEPLQKKPRLAGGPLGSAQGEEADDQFSLSIDVRKDLPAISRRMAEVVPEMHPFLEEYVDALDPDAGIEEEYHPKNDKLFSWRAVRLLSRQHLGMFKMIRRRDGDFERLVRQIYKEERDTDIAGEMLEDENIQEDEDEEAESSTKKNGEVSNGAAMKDEESAAYSVPVPDSEDLADASVGTPTDIDPTLEVARGETIEKGKKDNMSEFDKAALEEESEMMEILEKEKETEVEKGATPKQGKKAEEEKTRNGSQKKEKQADVVKETKPKQGKKAEEEKTRNGSQKKEKQADVVKETKPKQGKKAEEEKTRNGSQKKEKQADVVKEKKDTSKGKSTNESISRNDERNSYRPRGRGGPDGGVRDDADRRRNPSEYRRSSDQGPPSRDTREDSRYRNEGSNRGGRAEGSRQDNQNSRNNDNNGGRRRYNGGGDGGGDRGRRSH